jgi:hypothetical protein
MYPPEIGLRAEDSSLEQLASQARETLAQLKTDGVVGDEVVLQMATCNGWDEALDAADWQDGACWPSALACGRDRACASLVRRLKDPAAQLRPFAGAGANTAQADGKGPKISARRILLRPQLARGPRGRKEP